MNQFEISPILRIDEIDPSPRWLKALYLKEQEAIFEEVDRKSKSKFHKHFPAKIVTDIAIYSGSENMIVGSYEGGLEIPNTSTPFQTLIKYREASLNIGSYLPKVYGNPGILIYEVDNESLDNEKESKLIEYLCPTGANAFIKGEEILLTNQEFTERFPSGTAMKINFKSAIVLPLQFHIVDNQYIELIREQLAKNNSQ